MWSGSVSAIFEVRVDEKALGGRANKRPVEILAEHFKIPKSKITILKNKTIQEILATPAD